MMKKPNVKMAATLLTCGAFLCSSCIGSFGLFNKVLDWNKQAPGPMLPDEVVNNTIKVYSEALTKLMGAF